ncbi:uncharacterized protein LOC123540869 isoform X2 [Mercenaria mercenaria]|uniref:uncharacterized protein LOC123540869 isoform X2 n=1 Tax=Mercenaria mercenaria TaxID=6596 RepID=UPI00234F838C|nr:uncharacterized protein LOC123540869 isoform X2 [Mercenaria mercenaria]
MNTKEDPVAETRRHLEQTEKTRLLSSSRSVERGLRTGKTPTVYHWIYLCVLTAAIHLLFPNVREVFPLILACLAIGITMGTTAAQAPAIMFEASGFDRYPQGMAMVNVMYGIGDGLGPLLGGGVSVYMSISTIIAAYYMRRRNQQERLELW